MHGPEEGVSEHTDEANSAVKIVGGNVFVELDPELALTLLDQKAAGKTLMLITNSEWEYTQPMMKYAVERYLPEGMKWQDVFDLIIVSARKPDFFSTSSPFFEVLNEQGHLQRSLGPSDESKIYVGGNASAIEEYLGMSGDEILYVGDHIFADVNISKSLLRWRTALIVRPVMRGYLKKKGRAPFSYE